LRLTLSTLDSAKRSQEMPKVKDPEPTRKKIPEPGAKKTPRVPGKEKPEPPGKGRPTPDIFAGIIKSAVKEDDENKRSKLIVEFTKTVREIFNVVVKKHGRAVISKEDEYAITGYFDSLIKIIIVEDYRKRREDAASKIIPRYELAYSMLEANATEVKEVLKSFLDEAEKPKEKPKEKPGDKPEKEPGKEAEKELKVCPDALKEKVKPSQAKHISIKKPGPLVSLEAVSLSPDFAKYLREQHTKERPLFQLLRKGSFEKWLDTTEGKAWLVAQALDPNVFDKPELYSIAVHQAFARYEKHAYEELYSRPTHIPMPGIQYGHRLLGLPFVLSPPEKKFVEPNVYEGPTGRIQVPDVDFEELVRRYVNALYLKPITIYNLDDISDDQITNYFGEQIDILDPDKLALFQKTTKEVVTADVFLEFIRINQEQGVDLTLEKITDWLLEEASDFKDEIINSWSDTIAEVLPGTAPGLLEEMEDVSRYKELLYGLCAPNKLNVDNVGPNNAGAAYAYSLGTPPWQVAGVEGIKNEEKGPENYPEIGAGDELAQAVLKRIDALISVYDRAWRAVKAQLGEENLLNKKNEIAYSGYELWSWVSCLAVGSLRSLSGRNFNGYWAKIGSGATRLATNVVGYARLKERILARNLLVSEQCVWKELGKDVTGWSADAFYKKNGDLRTEFTSLIDKMADSYKAVLDVLSSLQPAARIKGSISEELGEEQVQNLYKHWTTIFANFLRAHSANRRFAKESRITVRLAPRSGKYEEVPKPESETGAFDPRKILPSHPRMQTEQYMLEPIPAKYACNKYPTLYLREDLSLNLQHRGFGIGANLYSMSLLPEEEQTITVKSFKDTEVKTSESTAENIFEEQTDETSKDYATEMRSESERESSSQREFNVSGKVSASWGWGSASIESGYSSQSSSRSLAKNASNVNNRLASKLSAKRTVSVETKRQVEYTEKVHSEFVTERKVKNPNKGHTLTFHWYQMTRKLATELRLNDVKLVYSSGAHNRQVVFGNGRCPQDVSENEFRYLPDDISKKLPPNSIIVVCTEPYSETVPLSNVNAFLTRVFTEDVSAKIGAMLWQLLGSGDPAPEGYGVAAFSGRHRSKLGNKCKYVSVTNPGSDSSKAKNQPGADMVPADEIRIKEDNKDIVLPNIDLRYKREEGLAPTRYSADEFDIYSLPRTLLREEQVINTNGVYCDAMVGQVSALEDYLQRHRDLDLLEKKIEVGGKELEFKWTLAKDGMVDIVGDKDQAIVGIVKERAPNQGFKDRLQVEEKKTDEETAIYAANLEKQRREQELKELEEKIKQIGQPTKYVVDLPKDGKVNVALSVGANGNNSRSVGVKVKEVDDGDS
jgi:hypothetical protein